MSARPDHLEASLVFAAAQVVARPGRLAESTEAHLGLATAAAAAGASLVIFPELSLTGYSTSLTLRDALEPEDAALDPLAELARRHRVAIVVGAPLASPRGVLIGSITFEADGSRGKYSKRYLHHSESPAFAAGDGGELLRASGRSVGLAICAEVNHPAHFPDTIARGAQVYAASCFLSPGGYAKDARRLATCTGLHGVPALMANFADSPELESAGGSAAWDDEGRLLAAAPRTGECLVLATRLGNAWHGHVIHPPFHHPTHP
jgi:predicted amidohydrolase